MGYTNGITLGLRHFFLGELGGWGSDGNLQMARNMEVTGL